MLVEEAEKMLTNQLIPFWKKLRDDQFGGYYGFMDYNLKIDKEAVKGCILHSRILWFFSSSYIALKRKDLLDEAKHTYEFLKNSCLDPVYGGIYWSVNYDGTVNESIKHTYNQAFAIYALSAYYRASGDREALEIAHRLYTIIEQKCTDEIGYLEAFDREFKPVSNEKLSENGVLADKTMNTLLHVFEGYSGLYEADHDEAVAKSLRRIINIFVQKVYNPEKQRQEVFFDREMNSILDLHSYGHDIETSWLLDWGCSLLGDKELFDQVSAVTAKLAENIYRVAYHKHSLWNECDRGVVNKHRVWWVQSETVIGFLNAYQKQPDNKDYLKAAEDVWEYIKNYVVDSREGSEWYWELDDAGKPIEGRPIVEPWKCPYHNGRMCLEIMRRKLNAAC